MTTIQNTKELPWCELLCYQVADEHEEREQEGDRRAYLFQQTEKALYCFIEI